MSPKGITNSVSERSTRASRTGSRERTIRASNSSSAWEDSGTARLRPSRHPTRTEPRRPEGHNSPGSVSRSTCCSGRMSGHRSFVQQGIASRTDEIGPAPGRMPGRTGLGIQRMRESQASEAGSASRWHRAHRGWSRRRRKYSRRWRPSPRDATIGGDCPPRFVPRLRVMSGPCGVRGRKRDVDSFNGPSTAADAPDRLSHLGRKTDGGDRSPPRRDGQRHPDAG